MHIKTSIHLLLFSCVALFLSCSGSPQDYVSLSGTIANTGQDSMVIHDDGYIKTLYLEADGSFKDTLRIPEKGYYNLSLGQIETNLFLENGYDLQIYADADSFITTVTFKGRGADNNSFVAEKTAFMKHGIGIPRDYFSLGKEAFDAKVDSLRNRLQAMFKNRQLDSSLVAREKSLNRRWINYLNSNYKQQHELYSNIEKGDPSPEFNHFESHAGGTISFEDLPDGYLYFFVWETGCGACRRDFPAFKRLQEQYSDKNITFVGISVDKKEDHDAWKRMVSAQDPEGWQLHTGAGYYRKFIRDYNIIDLPRYMLVDPDRNIVTAFAPSPLSPKLRKLFDELDLD